MIINLPKKTDEVTEMIEIKVKNNSVLLNGEKLSDEEVERYLRNGIKYEGLKERFLESGVKA